MNRLILILLFIGLIYLIYLYHKKLEFDYKVHKKSKKKRNRHIEQITVKKPETDSTISLDSIASGEHSEPSISLESIDSK